MSADARCVAYPRYVTIGKFHELTGYTEDAVRSKIRRGDWLQNRMWRKAPDGRILIDLLGYELWVVSNAVSEELRFPTTSAL